MRNIHGPPLPGRKPFLYHERVPPTARIIRKSSFTPKPWKNGAGVTYEAIRVPADDAAFAWRVSVARIENSGPFSDFSGYSRKMVLLEGDGLQLEFTGGGVQRLAHVGDLAEFDGAPAPHCALLGGPCVDLNLMVAPGYAAKASVAWLAGNETLEVRAEAAESTLIFSIDGALELTMDAQISSLQSGDLGLISNGSARVAGLESRAASNPSAVFFATISHSRAEP